MEPRSLLVDVITTILDATGIVRVIVSFKQAPKEAETLLSEVRSWYSCCNCPLYVQSLSHCVQLSALLNVLWSQCNPPRTLMFTRSMSKSTRYLSEWKAHLVRWRRWSRTSFLAVQSSRMIWTTPRESPAWDGSVRPTRLSSHVWLWFPLGSQRVSQHPVRP